MNASTFTPGVYAAYVDPAAAPPAATLSPSLAWDYADAQYACLIAGGVALFLNFAAYAAGRAPEALRALDVFGAELWVSAEETLVAPPEGLAAERGAWGDGARGFRAVPKARKFGGVMLLAGVIAGLALCGDAIAAFARDAGCVARQARSFVERARARARAHF
jgi:hypothetical protein